jgi:hypothetical protein
MIKWEDYLADKEHYQDLRREAEQSYWIKVPGGRNSLYNRALHWLGDHLVDWGRRLQKH